MKRPRRSSRPSRLTPPRARLGALDPVALFERLEAHFDDADSSPYRRLYAKSRTAFLRAEGAGAVTFAQLLGSVDEATPVESATRGAGFVVGFETCRRLLLGELDLDQLKGGAR